MLSRMVSGGALAAIVGATMLLAASGPSAAFTLSSPSLEQPVAGGGVVPAWWDRWGRWHPNAWGYGPARPWGWGYRPYYHPYVYGPVRHCWIGPWGYRHCSW